MRACSNSQVNLSGGGYNEEMIVNEVERIPWTHKCCLVSTGGERLEIDNWAYAWHAFALDEIIVFIFVKIQKRVKSVELTEVKFFYSLKI